MPVRSRGDAMKNVGGAPRLHATLGAAFGDASVVVREAPGLTILTAAIFFAQCLAYGTVRAALAPGLQTALLSVVDIIATCAVLAPLTVAIYRWTLLKERPGFSALFDKSDILANLIAVWTVVSLVVSTPLLLAEDLVQPEEAPVRFSAALAGYLILLALSVRLLLLEPAIATRSVLASFGASWRLTRGVYWRLVGGMAALILPTLFILIALAVIEVEGQPSPLIYAMLSVATAMLISLPGSAVIARYYAWRRDQG
jgi:hypothetical protein